MFKIVVAVVLFLLLPLPATTIGLGNCPDYDSARTCQLGVSTIWLPFGGLFFLGSIYAGGNQVFQSLVDYFWKVPALAAMAYIIACLVLVIFKKDKQILAS